MPIACSAPRPNNSIIRPVPVPMSTSRPIGALAQRAVDRRLDLALGDVERADRVPLAGMAGEIALGRGGAVGADRGEPGGIGGEQHARPSGSAQRSSSSNSGATRAGSARLQEHPAAFLAPLGEAGVGQDLDVARDARLALAEHLGELADRQLHRAQQREDAQPRRIGQRLEQVGKREAPESRYKDIKISLYASIEGGHDREPILPAAT